MSPCDELLELTTATLLLTSHRLANSANCSLINKSVSFPSVRSHTECCVQAHSITQLRQNHFQRNGNLPIRMCPAQLLREGLDESQGLTVGCLLSRNIS